MLGIIGGTGFYKLDGLTLTGEEVVETPFGAPSAPLTRAQYKNHDVVFLPRHGLHHNFMPHEINYRANVYALKKIGVRQAISISAVGSLRGDIPPGDFALPAQYIDQTRGIREKSFFGNGLVGHVSMARPVCPDLSAAIESAAQRLGMRVHTNKTYVCVDGPRFGTAAESHMLRGFGADLVGMTNVPEVFLMREAQIAYAAISIATDYDAWQDDPRLHADTATIIARYGKSLQEAQALILALLGHDIPPPSDLCRTSLAGALMTPLDALSPTNRALWDLLSA